MSRRNNRHHAIGISNSLGIAVAASTGIRPDAITAKYHEAERGVTDAFLARVRDAAFRLRNGELRSDVILRHGGCVVREAEEDLRKRRVGA